MDSTSQRPGLSRTSTGPRPAHCARPPRAGDLPQQRFEQPCQKTPSGRADRPDCGGRSSREPRLRSGRPSATRARYARRSLRLRRARRADDLLKFPGSTNAVFSGLAANVSSLDCALLAHPAASAVIATRAAAMSRSRPTKRVMVVKAADRRSPSFQRSWVSTSRTRLSELCPHGYCSWSSGRSEPRVDDVIERDVSDFVEAYAGTSIWLSAIDS